MSESEFPTTGVINASLLFIEQSESTVDSLHKSELNTLHGNVGHFDIDQVWAHTQPPEPFQPAVDHVVADVVARLEPGLDAIHRA
ncbi:hypothetical protein GGI13_002121 [Coemansia sp. RSA 455]|nr:hypothetical protein GGI13_002121 [Coemansia sp. RSA 455]